MIIITIYGTLLTHHFPRPWMATSTAFRTRSVSPCRAAGEGDERVISLQSRITLVDQFANVPRFDHGS